MPLDPPRQTHRPPAWVNLVGFAISGILVWRCGWEAFPILIVAVPVWNIGWHIHFIEGHGHRLARACLQKWGSAGKDILLVYSDDHRWTGYITTHWLPALMQRGIVINWSSTATEGAEDEPERELFRHFVGSRRLAPTLVWLLSDGTVQSQRFRRAFLEATRGNPKPLRGQEAYVSRLTGLRLPAGT